MNEIKQTKHDCARATNILTLPRRILDDVASSMKLKSDHTAYADGIMVSLIVLVRTPPPGAGCLLARRFIH